MSHTQDFWEEFVQAIQTFLTDKANMGSPTKKGRKDKPRSPLHLAEEDLRLGNLKLVPKGEDDEVFGMPIPNELITNNIRNAPYYNAYLEMVAKHDQKIAAKKGGKKKPSTAKQLKPKPVKEKSSKPAPAPKTKATQVKPAKPSLAKHSKIGEEYDVERAIQMSLESFHAQSQANVGGVAIREPVAEATRPLPVVEGKGKAIATEQQSAQSLLALHTPKRRSTTDQFIFQRRTPATEEASIGPFAQPQDDTSANIVRDSPSPADAETSADTDKTNSGEEKTTELDQGQAGSDPGKTPESRPPLEQDLLSSSGTLSSMKNLDDAYTIGDQFLNDKSTKDESGKLNVEAKVVSMVTVLIYQASYIVPPLSTSMIGLSPPKPVPSTTQAPIFTATTTTTTTTLPLSPPPQQQSSTDSEVFTLELRDLPHKINQTVNEVVKEVVHVALQAPLRDRFRELPEADMKEILHQRMFESGTYKSLPEHVALYEALEASMKRTDRDEFLAEKDKLRKRRRDDQDPPPPSPDSNLNKKKIHDSDASSKQKSAPLSEQPVEDVPIPDVANVLDSEDTNSAHLPKIKTRPDWLKPILEEDKPATPEPDWVIPPNDLQETENNWANTLASSYQDPDEYKLP
ncbi:hypothetical protein Tco_1212765 [Tanacetum coccineum]